MKASGRNSGKHKVNQCILEVTLTLLLCAFCGLASAAESWHAPGTAILDIARVFPKNISAAQWLWHQTDKVKPGECFYRFSFTLEKAPVSGYIITYLDDSGTIYLNGRKLVPVAFKQTPMPVKALKFDLKPALKQGENVLACKVDNTYATGGMILRGEITLDNGKKMPLVSTPQFKAVATAAAGWEQPGFDDSAWPAAMNFGDVQTLPWSNVSDIVNLCSSPEEIARQKACLAKAINPPDFSSEPDLTAKIVYRGNMPGLEVNGRIYPPVLYMSAEPWLLENADMTAKMGIVGVPIIEYRLNSRRLVRDDGSYDFTYIDTDIRRILTLHPKAMLSINVYFSELANWLKMHPGEAIGYATGPNDGKLVRNYADFGRKDTPSMASKAFRNEMNQFVFALGNYIKSNAWSKRVVMMRVSYGIFSEWHYFGMLEDMPDTGSAMTARFREFLTERYKNDGALQKAWQDPDVTLKTAKVPGVSERRGKDRFLREPGSKDQQTWDYYDCHQLVVAEALVNMAAAAKEAMPKLLVGAYYGYVLGMGEYPSEGQTLAMEKVLSSPYIDFLSSPYDYRVESRPAGGSGLSRTIPSMFAKYKKLPLNEADTRTHLTVGASGITVADSVAMISRDMVRSFLDGMGVHLLHVSQRAGQTHWLNDPQILTAIHDSLTLWQEMYAAEATSTNQVAVIVNPDELVHHGYPERVRQLLLNTALVDMTLHNLCKTGSAFDLFELNDFLTRQTDYRFLIFANIFTLSTEQRKLLVAKTRQKGLSAVWIYAPGLITENGYSEAAMRELTGIDLAAKTERLPLAVRLADGRMIEYRGPDNSMPLIDSPRVYSRDKDVKLIGSYADDRSPAIVSKKLPGGTVSIFSGTPLVRLDLWRSFFAEAGIHQYADAGVVIKANSRFVMVHVGTVGDYTISLPKKAAKITEIFSGKTVGKGTDKVILKATSPMTYVLKID